MCCKEAKLVQLVFCISTNYALVGISFSGTAELRGDLENCAWLLLPKSPCVCACIAVLDCVTETRQLPPINVSIFPDSFATFRFHYLVVIIIESSYISGANIKSFPLLLYCGYYDVWRDSTSVFLCFVWLWCQINICNSAEFCLSRSFCDFVVSLEPGDF